MHSDCSDCGGAEDSCLQLRRDSGEQLDISMTRVAQPYVSPIVTRTVNRDGKPVGLIRVKAFNARTRAEIADAVAGFQVRCSVCLLLTWVPMPNRVITEGAGPCHAALLHVLHEDRQVCLQS